MSVAGQFLNIFRIRDLRHKLLITIGLLALCRVGVYVPLPGIDAVGLESLFKGLQGQPGGRLLGLLNVFAGGALRRGAIFGLGIMPYISASIIFQLLASAVPALEKLRKEGEAGRKKLNQYMRVSTVFICLFQGAVVTKGLFGVLIPAAVRESWFRSFSFTMTNAFLMMAGTMFLMWIGEQIDEHGIGNGISLIIMVNILARMPAGVSQFAWQVSLAESHQNAILKVGVMLVLFVAVVVGIVYITQGERRIPVQQARHVRGPKVYGGQKHYLPLRVNQAGVIPIIFAQALLMFPSLIAASVVRGSQSHEGVIYSFFAFLDSALAGRTLSFTYVVSYALLIFFFCYFWTAVMFNPQEMSENLKDYGSFIPGIRPGKRTAQYLEGIMNRVTIAGSFFLIVIALMPMLIASALQLGGRWGIASFYGGTTLLIVVGVSLDLVRRINDHLEMRRYSGFTAGTGGRRRSRRQR